jgi:hypothetical protein
LIKEDFRENSMFYGKPKEEKDCYFDYTRAEAGVKGAEQRASCKVKAANVEELKAKRPLHYCRGLLSFLLSTRSGNRTRTSLRSQDFKSCVSTCSTIPASANRCSCFKRKAPISWCFSFKSERRGSNPRPRPWQGRALPAELLSLICHLLSVFRLSECKGKTFFLSCKPFLKFFKIFSV